MKIPLLTIAVSLTIASASTSYHLSSLPTPTEAQKNLITVMNTAIGTGLTEIFGLLNDEEH
jgi:hypothetical protein